MADQARPRRAVVTGGARGIGAAVGEVLHRAGYEVVLGDTRADVAERSAARLGTGASAFELDVADAAAVQRLAETLRHRWDGGLDALVTAAGMEVNATLPELEQRDWDRMLAVGLTGQYLCLRAFLPLLREAQGAVVCVGSVMGHAVYPGASAYAATKAGLEGFVKAAALDCAPGVRVNCVLPGAADTPMLRRDLRGQELDRLLDRAAADIPLGRVAEPAEIADVIAFLLSSGARYMTGSSVVVDGGLLTRLATDA